jgi:hypothetical protein
MNPNIFVCRIDNASPFLKGVLWAANAVKMGYKWIIGDGSKVGFRENQSFGHIPAWQFYSGTSILCAISRVLMLRTCGMGSS